MCLLPKWVGDRLTAVLTSCKWSNNACLMFEIKVVGCGMPVERFDWWSGRCFFQRCIALCVLVSTSAIDTNFPYVQLLTNTANRIYLAETLNCHQFTSCEYSSYVIVSYLALSDSSIHVYFYLFCYTWYIFHIEDYKTIITSSLYSTNAHHICSWLYI